MLNIIGIGESAEPTDIAPGDEQEYLARGIRAPMPVTDVLPVRPGRVFVDTSAYFAAPTAAMPAMNPLPRSCGLVEVAVGWSPPTSSLPSCTRCLTRLDRRIAGKVLSEVDASELTTVERVTARDERRAREIVFGYTDKDFSLTDATSFAVMERIRIGQAFTLDRNFVQFGWVGADPTAHS